MNTPSTFGTGLLAALAMVNSVGAALAQAPTITAVSPAANAVAAPRSGPLTVSFSQPLATGSAAALKVFSSQRGGLRTRGATLAVVNGSSLSFTPTAYPFVPGETVQYTATTAATGSGGALSQARVGQFTAAVGGTGRGRFSGGSTVTLFGTSDVTIADVDGDGDGDLLRAYPGSLPSYPGNTVYLGLNNGNGGFSGSYSAGTSVAVGDAPGQVIMNDVDGDSDLDLLTGNYIGTVSVRLNNGTGSFGGGSEVPLAGAAQHIEMGDIDGDGDLDIVAATSNSRISVRLNDGTGTFGSGSEIMFIMNSSFATMALGDMDNDGDLDLVGTDTTTPTNFFIRFNDGHGTFSGNVALPVPQSPNSIAKPRLLLADLNGDGSLDVIFNSHQYNITILFNTGNGSTFSGSYSMALGVPNTSLTSGGLTGIALGDVDADGDLDLLASFSYSNSAGPPPGLVAVRLNNGSGQFGPGQDVSAPIYTSAVALADVDNDGDLDILSSMSGNNNSIVQVNLNQQVLATAASQATATFSYYPNPVRSTVNVVGTAPYAALTLLDALGRPVFAATSDAAGTAALALPTGMASGLYILKAGAQAQRLMVE